MLARLLVFSYTPPHEEIILEDEAAFAACAR